MAFIRINERRFKDSSIQEYESGTSAIKGQPTVTIKISGRKETFYFETVKRQQEILAYLDKVLNVKDA